MKKVCMWYHAVVMIILLLTISCQLPGDKNEEIREKLTTDNTEVVEEDKPDVVESDEPELEDVNMPPDDGGITEPVDTGKNNTEVSMETYKDFLEYHYPAALAGKTVETDNGQRYVFGLDGITLPVNNTLYPNPVTPDMFNNTIEGTTSERVSDGGEVFTYELSMSGKFSYKNNEYYGEVLIIVEKTDTELLVNNVPAVFVE